jgi:hypothetical protein
MRDVMAAFRIRAALLVLESMAANAGSAMACPFGSSAEFEAAVIRRKREADAYARKRRLRRVLTVTAAGLLFAALLCMI